MSSTEKINPGKLNGISIITQFQPIISVKKNKIIGVEALSRGFDAKTNTTIPPVTLFSEATKNINCLIELDRRCRESALLHFKETKKTNKDMLLFLNIESAILDTVRKSNYLFDRVRDLGLNPSDIVLEINESKINNIEALICFVQRYKKHRFIIALDDVGAGFSNLNRIPLLGPDVIKIDRFLLSGIDGDYYKKEVFKSLVGLASNTGSLVVAEGIETQEEAILATELGADMMQGFFFAKPAGEVEYVGVNRMIDNFVSAYKSSMKKASKAKRVLIGKLKDVSREILGKISGAPAEAMEEALKDFISQQKGIECMYVLDGKGRQISRTVFKNKRGIKNKNVLFSPASTGTDHSLKEYYYHLVNNNNRNYISHKYMSMATGNMCITLSQAFFDASGAKNILCIDFLAE